MTLTHPDTGQTVEVLEGSERPYIVNGWLPVKNSPARPHRRTETTSNPGRETK